MTKKQRIRWEIARATRLNAAGAARNADLDLIHGWYMTNATCIGGLRVHGAMYSGGDYWN